MVLFYCAAHCDYLSNSSIDYSSKFIFASNIDHFNYLCSVYSFPCINFETTGFFFGNVYFSYKNIYQINLAEGNILVIDMQSGKRLLVHLLTEKDREQVVEFLVAIKIKGSAWQFMN